MFPKTLAAPAIAPNTPVISGFMGLLGLSPGYGRELQSGDRKVKGSVLRAGEEHGPGYMKVGHAGGGALAEMLKKCLEVGWLGHRHTSIPVAQGGHDKEANGLVGSLLQHSGCEALVCPLQS